MGRMFDQPHTNFGMENPQSSFFGGEWGKEGRGEGGKEGEGGRKKGGGRKRERGGGGGGGEWEWGEGKKPDQLLQSIQFPESNCPIPVA